jgi:NTP pyrophosphatase (non-canonical NTP hydrolase)
MRTEAVEKDFFNWELSNGRTEYQATPMPYDHTVDYLEELVTEWHQARNLIDGSSDKDQFAKLIQECGELSESICKDRSVADDIGDIMVVLINIAARNNLNLNQCLGTAYNDIKDRKGRMVDGVFVKEADNH